MDDIQLPFVGNWADEVDDARVAEVDAQSHREIRALERGGEARGRERYLLARVGGCSLYLLRGMRMCQWLNVFCIGPCFAQIKAGTHLFDEWHFVDLPLIQDNVTVPNDVDQAQTILTALSKCAAAVLERVSVRCVSLCLSVWSLRLHRCSHPYLRCPESRIRSRVCPRPRGRKRCRSASTSTSWVTCTRCSGHAAAPAE